MASCSCLLLGVLPRPTVVFLGFTRHFACVVSVQGGGAGWRAGREWVRSDGSLNLDFLQERFGQASVKATDTSRCGAGHENQRCDNSV